MGAGLSSNKIGTNTAPAASSGYGSNPYGTNYSSPSSSPSPSPSRYTGGPSVWNFSIDLPLNL